MAIEDYPIFELIVAAYVAIAVVVVARAKRLFNEELRRLQKLYRKVKGLRLYKMLEFIGAPVDKYIRQVPAREIEKHIERCSQCEELDICDKCLFDGRRVGDMGFCPNFADLTQLSKTFNEQTKKTGKRFNARRHPHTV